MEAIIADIMFKVKNFFVYSYLLFIFYRCQTAEETKKITSMNIVLVHLFLFCIILHIRCLFFWSIDLCSDYYNYLLLLVSWNYLKYPRIGRSV